MEPADRTERKRRGAWYTPPALVRFLIEQAVEPAAAEAGRAGLGQAGPARPGADGRGTADRLRVLDPARRLRVLDPACGDGRLLAAARDPACGNGRLPAGAGWALDLVGVELDPGAADAARSAVPTARILVGDGRTLDPGGRFDVVIGNPPYLGQLARDTSRRGRSHLGGGPYADVAAEFLMRAVALARPDGGRVALVLPQSMLASRDTGSVRAAVTEDAALTGLWWAAGPVFDAAVNVCIVVLRRGIAQGPIHRWRGASFTPLPDAPASAVSGPTWSPLVADAAGIPTVHLPTHHGRVADLASATAGFRDQYYGLVPHVSDTGDGPPLVTSGLIDVGECAWGHRPARFAKRRFVAPRVDLAALAASDPRLAAWVQRQLRPKVLVATQTRVIEAVVDGEGAWVPSVPVVAVHPHRPEDVWALGALLLAPPVAAWAAARYLGAGLGATAIKLSARQVLDLPLPARPWREAADLLRLGDVDGAAAAMCAAYGLSAAEAASVLQWWRSGTRSRALSGPSLVE